MPSTARLLLREWRPEDREPFAQLCADPEVMRHFPAPLSRGESDALAARIEAWFAVKGWGLWAVEPTSGPDGGRFAGFVGLNPVPEEMSFSPAVEVGWRLARWAWGRGYASEGGGRSVRYGFEELGLGEIVSFTTVGNDRSRAVMERIGMSRDPAEDFGHPLLPAGDPLRPHVLYRVAAD